MVIPSIFMHLEGGDRELYGKTSKTMFPPIFSENEYYQQQSFGRLKKCVEEALGVGFEIRAGRRSFGQRRIDQGNDISDVSYAMGHSTTKTTERYYGRVKKSSVNERMLAAESRASAGRSPGTEDVWVRS